jgi:hypothetical protein
VRGQKLKLRALFILCAGVVMAFLGIVSGAVAAGTHTFDPKLSLTGNCAVSPLDEIPDPGPCPGTPGVDHPAVPFNNPRAVATDAYGNIYVASPGPDTNLTSGRIDIFDSTGNFITEVADPSGPTALAVDSEGNLYVGNSSDESDEALVRYSPTTYEPAAGNIEYDDPPVVLAEHEAFGDGLAIDRLNDHLFRKKSSFVIEYNSKTEGNEVVDETLGVGELNGENVGLAVDAARGRVYATSRELGSGEAVIKAFKIDAPHELLFTVNESEVPGEHFVSSYFSLAVDEGTGHLFLYDGIAKKVYEFDESGAYVSTIEYGFQYTYLSQIAVDNGEQSPNGALNSRGRYLFVPSHPGAPGHSFAFGPPNEGPPRVESVSAGNIGEAEAELRASIDPFGLVTHYIFQYLTQEQFEAAGGTFTGAQVVEGDIPAENVVVDVAGAIDGLTPGTAYRFRVVVTNSEGSDEADGAFGTYPVSVPSSNCSNQALRTGFSALLPDCRAYELVTPPETSARSPRGVAYLGVFFPTREVSPDGSALSFQIEGGIIPGSNGSGSLAGDPYLSTRGASGWSTAMAGPASTESPVLKPGSTSPDQGYSFWTTSGGSGSAAINGEETFYVRYPDGHSALIGRGSLANDPQALGNLISENGGHIIFSVEDSSKRPAVQLEPEAPPQVEEEVEGKVVIEGTSAIYDRTSDEITHVVSLLPGEETPKTGEDAKYIGASLDGRGVVFKIGGRLYLRYDNQETFAIGQNVTYAGVAEGGNRIFYLEDGDIYRFDALTGNVMRFTETGNATAVNVSGDGSAAYFVSPTALPGLENPNGAEPLIGKENLYRSKEGTISFVGTVTKRDVEGEEANPNRYGGLGLWTYAQSDAKLGADPSRTTADGAVLIFESRAALDGYDPEGQVEVYRYDLTTNKLDCLSCLATGIAPSGGASLQSLSQGLRLPEPLGPYAYVNNLTRDGNRAFFQSTEALVPGDSDGLQDVYEWEDQGVGSCSLAGGCVYLISSGHSAGKDYLYAVSDSGDDVFFRTSDILLPSDAEETPSIYDARVKGGFPEPVSGECEGEGCRPGLTPAPAMPGLSSKAGGPSGNPTHRHRGCPKSKRRVRHNGKVRCVKKHHKHRHHREAGTKQKGAAR